MNRRRRFRQRWLLWGLTWVFVLASLAPAISRMQAADGDARLRAVQTVSAGARVDASAASVQVSVSGDGLSLHEQRAATAVCDPALDVASRDALAADHPGFPAAGHEAPTHEGSGPSAGQGVPADLRASLLHGGHAGHHAGILTADAVNVLTQLPVGMPSLDCCPFCAIMADRLSPVWHELPLLLDRTLVRVKPAVREPMAPTVVVLRLPPVRAPPVALPLQI